MTKVEDAKTMQVKCSEENTLLESELENYAEKKSVTEVHVVEEKEGYIVFVYRKQTKNKRWYIATRRDRDAPKLWKDLGRLNQQLKILCPGTKYVLHRNEPSETGGWVKYLLNEINNLEEQTREKIAEKRENALERIQSMYDAAEEEIKKIEEIAKSDIDETYIHALKMRKIEIGANEFDAKVGVKKKKITKKKSTAKRRTKKKVAKKKASKKRVRR